jgi:hypothetical protein
MEKKSIKFKSKSHEETGKKVKRLKARQRIRQAKEKIILVLRETLHTFEYNNRQSAVT